MRRGKNNYVYVVIAYLLLWANAAWAGPLELAKLTASDGDAGDLLGYFVSISGDYAILGTPFDEDNGYLSGSAYIFHWDGTSWIQQQKLLASDGAVSDCFSISVSISGDYAIVGAYGDDDVDLDDLKLFVYDWLCPCPYNWPLR